MPDAPLKPNTQGEMVDAVIAHLKPLLPYNDPHTETNAGVIGFVQQLVPAVMLESIFREKNPFNELGFAELTSAINNRGLFAAKYKGHPHTPVTEEQVRAAVYTGLSTFLANFEERNRPGFAAQVEASRTPSKIAGLPGK